MAHAVPPPGQNFVEKTHNDTYPFIDPKKLNLAGKTVFVSGASKGIGRALTLAYAQAGASGLVLGARSDLSSLEHEILKTAKDANRDAPKVLSVSLDVTDLESVEAAAKKVESTFGKLDILVNNAGYLSAFEKMIEGSAEEWWKTWEVNVKGVYFATRAFIPLILKSELKTIVNISSIGAHLRSPGASSYQTTKLAVSRLTEFTALEYADEGILTFSIHPGGVMTELAKNMPKDRWANLMDTAELGADTMVFLTSEKRDWLNGRYLSVSWDMELFLKKKEQVVQGDLLKVRLAL